MKLDSYTDAISTKLMNRLPISSRRTMSFRRRNLLYFLPVLLYVLAQYVLCQSLDDAFHGCSIPDEKATVANFSYCMLFGVPDELKICKDLTILDLSRNSLESPNLDFSMFPKLYRIYLSYNLKLGNSNITAFIVKSPSAKFLDLSYSGFGIIQPSVLQTPKLRYLILTGKQECEETQKLFNRAKQRVKVICAGTSPHPVRPKPGVSSTTLSPLDLQPSTYKPLHHPSEASTSSDVTGSRPTTSYQSVSSSTTLATSPATPQNTTTPVPQPPTECVECVVQYPVKHILRLVVSIVVVAIVFLACIFWDETVSMLRRIFNFLARYVRRTVG